MLELINIHKTFNKGTVNEKTALAGINLSLAQGDFVTIIGGNGAGKSTMLNMIAGVYPIDEGKIILDGADISKKTGALPGQISGTCFSGPDDGNSIGYGN